MDWEGEEEEEEDLQGDEDSSTLEASELELSDSGEAQMLPVALVFSSLLELDPGLWLVRVGPLWYLLTGL